MPSIFTLLNDSWTFARKQPVLLHVGFWLLFLPFLGMNRLSAYLEAAQKVTTNDDVGSIIFAILGILALSVIALWGAGCVLVVGSRLLAAKSGRSRTSFKAVRSEARAFIIPLLLTNILRSVITALWGLLLVIPGIIYSLNTVFCSVIVVVEGMNYRQALRRSSAVMKGHRLPVYLRILGLALLTFGPASILSALISSLPVAGIDFFADLISSVFYAFSSILFSLTLILFFGALRPATAPVTGTAGGRKKVIKKK